MGYVQALEKAWSQLNNLTTQAKFSLRLLADEYEVNLKEKTVISLSCNIPAKEHIGIILLHYLTKKLELKALPQISGEWLEFRQLEGGQPYYPVFKKRVIDTIVKKYGKDPDKIFDANQYLSIKRIQFADIGIVIEALEAVPVLITFWRADEEFGPQANILFDENITKIFCTEDIVVLAEFLVHQV